MSPRLAYSPEYEVEYPGHPFATKKFSLTAKALENLCEIAAPTEPSREDLLLAHGERWVDKVLSSTLTHTDVMRLELPFSPQISRAHRLAVGGTISAARWALEDGIGLHAGGGSHHAFADHGEGYCALNDLAVAILKLKAEGAIRRAAVVDLDVHQGNGTASIFARDHDVFTFSMHQDDIYPPIKIPSSLDIGLRPGTRDEEFLELLGPALRRVVDYRPDIILYQSGVDIWEHDQLGGLKISERGIRARDEAVLAAARGAGIPIAVTLGGGYGPTPRDTARLHAATLSIFAAYAPGTSAASLPKVK